MAKPFIVGDRVVPTYGVRKGDSGRIVEIGYEGGIKIARVQHADGERRLYVCSDLKRS